MLYVRTEIEAINTILRMVGEAPVNSTNLSDLAPGAQAQTLLRQISRSVQSQGWYFNTRVDKELTPGSNGKILLSANTLAIEPTRSSDVLLIRGNLLYNMTEETDEFLSPVRATLIVGLEFDELPETFKEYITMLAGMRYTASYSKSDIEFRFSENEVQEVRARCMGEELRNRRYRFAVNYRRVL